MHLHLVIPLALSLLATEANAIECTRAISNIEQRICSDPLLIRLDTALNNNYRWMLNAHIGIDARNALRQSQRIWLRQRNQCIDRECLLSVYKQRIEQVCDYPVTQGIHPICDEPDMSESAIQRD